MSFFSAKRVGELNSRVASDTSQIGETLTTTLAEFLAVFLRLWYCHPRIHLDRDPIYSGSHSTADHRDHHLWSFIQICKKVQDEVAASNTIVEETFAGIQTVSL